MFWPTTRQVSCDLPWLTFALSPLSCTIYVLNSNHEGLGVQYTQLNLVWSSNKFKNHFHKLLYSIKSVLRNTSYKFTSTACGACQQRLKVTFSTQHKRCGKLISRFDWRRLLHETHYFIYSFPQNTFLKYEVTYTIRVVFLMLFDISKNSECDREWSKQAAVMHGSICQVQIQVPKTSVIVTLTLNQDDSSSVLI